MRSQLLLSMERPGAATVGLLLTRAVLSKAPWLAKIGVDAQWPMQGVPKVLHLDNAAEIKNKALRSGCREYGIDLMYREQRRALKAIREAGQHSVSEAQIFRTVEDQRRVIVKARRATLSARCRARSRNVPSVEILDRWAQSGSARSR
jgi:hypothetical protein